MTKLNKKHVKKKKSIYIYIYIFFFLLLYLFCIFYLNSVLKSFFFMAKKKSRHLSPYFENMPLAILEIFDLQAAIFAYRLSFKPITRAINAMWQKMMSWQLWLAGGTTKTLGPNLSCKWPSMERDAFWQHAYCSYCIYQQGLILHKHPFNAQPQPQPKKKKKNLAFPCCYTNSWHAYIYGCASAWTVKCWRWQWSIGFPQADLWMCQERLHHRLWHAWLLIVLGVLGLSESRFAILA